MSRALLVRGQDMGNFILVFIKCIVNIENRSSRISEYRVYTLFFQALNYDFCSCQFIHTPYSLSLIERSRKL